MLADTLAGQFDIPGALHFEAAPNGLTRAVISTPAAEAEIYLHGAHVTHWKPSGQAPVLFVSSKSLFEPGKAIRGGVPVIFPWFGPRGEGKAGPMHGFARTAEWAVESTKLTNGNVEIAFTLAPSEMTRSLGFDAFHVRFRVTACQPNCAWSLRRKTTPPSPGLRRSAAYLLRHWRYPPGFHFGAGEHDVHR